MSSASWGAVWSTIDQRARFGIKPGLERMEQLLEALDHPEHGFRGIRIAGSNGKGSTAYLLDGLLRTAGVRTGLYTSPHVLHPGERIRVNGEIPAEGLLLKAWKPLDRLIPIIEPSYFELLTALAFSLFREAGVEWALLECGLGARHDATAAASWELGILTSINHDHLEILGPELEDVLRDKAHVAPVGGVLLCAELEPGLQAALDDVCDTRNARVEALPSLGPIAEDGTLALASGGFSIQLPVASTGWKASARLALAAARWLQSSGAVPGLLPECCFRARAVEWPGRFQLLRQEPPLLIDTAHNPSALALLAADIGDQWPDQRFDIVICGMHEKDLAGNLDAIRPLLGSLQVWVPDDHPRAAGRTQWTRAAHAADVEISSFLDNEQLNLFKQSVSRSPAGTGRATLLCGSFLIVSQWLGAATLPPGV